MDVRERLRAVTDWRRLYSEIKGCDVHRLSVSFWCSVAFVGLGSAIVVFGPTLLDLADHLSVGVGALAFMFALRAVGSVCGTVGSGILMDKLERLSYTILSLILLSAIAITVVLPLSVHIVMLGALMLVQGIALGALDNGVHAILMKMWGDKVGPCMQVLHFAFALGAFFAPLISKPFIRETRSNDDLTCSDLLQLNLDSDVYGSSNGTGLAEYQGFNCTELILTICANLTDAALVEIDNITDSLNCTITEDTIESKSTLSFAWAYWISASFFILPSIASLYYSFRLELVKCFQTKDVSNPSEDHAPLVEETEHHEEDKQKERKKVSMKQSLLYKIAIFSLLFSFLFIYVGMETAYGSLIFTVAVTGELNFSKQKAALLASVFWGTFAFTRLFSVILALLKTPASIMMSINLTGSLIAATILVIFPHIPVAVWIGSALLGTSYASIYPTTMTWLGEHVEVSGKATAVLVSGGNLGDIVLPSAAAALIAHVTPDSLIYFTFCSIVLSALIVATLFVTTYVQKKRSSCTRVQYLRMERNEEATEELENGINLEYVNGSKDEESEAYLQETEL